MGIHTDEIVATLNFLIYFTYIIFHVYLMNKFEEKFKKIPKSKFKIKDVKKFSKKHMKMY